MARRFPIPLDSSPRAAEQIKSGAKVYNFGTSGFGVEEAPGIGVFYRDEAGNVFHTYSCFARGLDMMNAAYHYLDLTPLGRQRGPAVPDGLAAASFSA